jgi:hypothetical protein
LTCDPFLGRGVIPDLYYFFEAAELIQVFSGEDAAGGFMPQAGPREGEQTMNQAVGYLMAFGFVPLVLFAWWYTYRTIMRTVHRSLRLNESSRWLCPTCDSPKIERLPGNRISPYPGYVCRTCGQRMRPPGSTAIYVVLATLGLGLLAFFTAGFWGDFDAERLIHGAEIIAAMVVVPSFSIWQLSRPTPRRAEDG